MSGASAVSAAEYNVFEPSIMSIDIYKKYGFKLIELQDKDVQNLDDILPRLLLRHGVQAY